MLGLLSFICPSRQSRPRAQLFTIRRADRGHKALLRPSAVGPRASAGARSPAEPSSVQTTWSLYQPSPWRQTPPRRRRPAKSLQTTPGSISMESYSECSPNRRASARSPESAIASSSGGRPLQAGNQASARGQAVVRTRPVVEGPPWRATTSSLAARSDDTWPHDISR